MPVKNIDLTFHQEAILCSDSYNQEREVSSIKVSSYSKFYHPDERSGICVVRRRGETDDELLKRFRKKFSKSGLTKEIREKMYYEKPSDKRRRKKMQSIRLLQREAEKQAKIEEKFEKFKRKQQLKNRKENNKNDSSSRRQNYRRSYESRKN
jgi:small subunit ribosomal protein S21